MTRGDAEKSVRERWERLGLNPLRNPGTFHCDVDNMLGCTCIRFYDYSPHHPNCPLSNMEVTHEAH